MRLPLHTVLVVDDDVMVLATMAAILCDAGYDVVTATSGPEAMLCASRVTVDLLVSDVVMPGMNGRELADRIGCCHPGLRVLFVSGNAGDLLAGSPHPLLDKPFSPDELVAAVSSLLEMVAS